MKRAILACILVLGAAAGTELLKNGGFELQPDSGWSLNVQPPPSPYTLERSTRFVHDPDNEVLLYKGNESVASLSQTVWARGPGTFFGCLGRFWTYEYDTLSVTWAAAGVRLQYKDTAGTVLGETRIANLSEHCPWQSDSFVHVIPADGNWNTWLLDIGTELANLPGVSPAAVRFITVQVIDTTDGVSPGDCGAWAWVDDVSLFDTLGADFEAAAVIIDDGHNGILDPLEGADVLIRLRNTGPYAANVRGSLSADNPLVTVIDGLAGWGSMDPGDTSLCVADRFRIEADWYSPPMGDSARLSIVLTAGLAVVETLEIDIPLGDSISMPSGPDQSGQLAFEDGDWTSQAPEFGWIEVHGLGTQLVLSDDQTVTIDLPDSFEFRRYGTNYTRLSVCSNGWVAPGTTTNAAYANTPLPNSSMPGGMIAANWDDLYPPTGNGVWCHYDSVFDWLVVEWDSVAYYGNPTLPDKFEIVILGRSHPSPSEDNSIRLQYLTAFGFYSSTIGVQNLSSSNAIQLCFNDDYARTAAPIVPGRAIQFEEAWQVPVAEQRHDVMSQPELWVGPSLFRDRLLIRLSGRWQGNVSLKVYNTAGQAVATLLDQLQKPGRYTLTWDGRDNNERTLSSGVYFVALEAAGRRLKQKVVLASRGE